MSRHYHRHRSHSSGHASDSGFTMLHFSGHGTNGWLEFNVNNWQQQLQHHHHQQQQQQHSGTISPSGATGGGGSCSSADSSSAKERENQYQNPLVQVLEEHRVGVCMGGTVEAVVLNYCRSAATGAAIAGQCGSGRES